MEVLDPAAVQPKSAVTQVARTHSWELRLHRSAGCGGVAGPALRLVRCRIPGWALRGLRPFAHYSAGERNGGGDRARTCEGVPGGFQDLTVVQSVSSRRQEHSWLMPDERRRRGRPTVHMRGEDLHWGRDGWSCPAIKSVSTALGVSEFSVTRGYSI